LNKPRVVVSGIFYPMAILRYFEAAFQRRQDIELVTMGIYTGRKIPWGGGMLLAERYAKPPDIVLPKACRKGVPIQMALSKLNFVPDLWIQIDAGMWLIGCAPKKVQSVVVGTDPHVLDYGAQRKTADKFFCMQKHYAKPGDIYLPYAYDPVWHRPEVQPKRFDAALLGLKYRTRQRWVSRLRDHHVKVKFELGPVFEEARALYNQARVGLNWSSRDDLVARVFELTAMGLPLVTNTVPDLKDFFVPGVDVLAFNGVDAATQLVRALLSDPQMAQEVAASGHRAVKSHTYDARVDQILRETVFA